MKQMKLVQLKLSNFKGIKSFTLDAQGENVRVFGDNATGKTTLFDAFVWLLFGKDSQNKTDFAIKTLDSSGKEIHGLDHEVEGIFLVDGKQLALRKVYAEKWTKKRGSATAEFTGHTTDYFIDGVPSKKKEYDDKISQIVNEDIFKLLTSPSYFNEQLHWQKRREILLEVCGDISDAEVIASTPSLAKLTDILDGRSIEDHRKIIASKHKGINDELNKIPIRIDEINHNLPDITGLDEALILSEITHIKSLIQDKESEIARIRSGGEIAEKQKQLREIESELLQLRNEHQAAKSQVIKEKQKELNMLQYNVSDFENKIYTADLKVASNKRTIERLSLEAEQLREKWHEVNNQELEFCQDENCPSCGQTLPLERLEEAKAKALADFNRDKATKLESISIKGKGIKSDIERLEAQNESLLTSIREDKEILASLKTSLEKSKSEFDNLAQQTDLTNTPEYQQKQAEIEQIKQQISQLESSVYDSINAVQSEINKLRSEVAQLEADKAKINQVKQSEERIKELSEQERKLAAEFEQLEHELFLTEEFIRAKVNMLEDKINSRFKYARFKLFRTQVNGGLEEVCETTYEGVPYGSGLNNAARINVGLDIINTLSEHYGFSAPIFVDNSESVTKLIEIDSQVISLVVSEQDKQLRVEQKATAGVA